MSTAKSSSFLPDDVLIIHYADLSSDPLTRLQTAAAIGKLLGTDDESRPLSELAQSTASAEALRAWLNDNQANHFLKIEDGLIIHHRLCEKHILVGTSLLLRDLSSLEQSPRLPRLTDLDLVWHAASRLAEQDRTI